MFQLLQRLKPGFKRTINCNKYPSKETKQTGNTYLDFLIDSSFQGVDILFGLSFENNTGRTSYKQYYLPRIEIKNYNVMIDGQKFFDQPIQNDPRTYDNI